MWRDIMNNIKSIYPEVGKLIKVRNGIYQISKVEKFKVVNENEFLLTLENLENNEILKIIYKPEKQIEISPEIINTPTKFSDIENIDNPKHFDAFIKAIKWSTNSIFLHDSVKSPFYSNIILNHYQLDPLVRALTMPRISLLIADDVGLGKTIEAGLIIQELILRKKIRRILIVCPASLQEQWQREMSEKFSLEFKIMNSKEISKIFKEYGVNINPWITYPRLITSMDFIKREKYLSMFDATTQGDKKINWDMLIVDEAHNILPRPYGNYFKDSDRTKAIRNISQKFTHKIFLTATPHNGDTRSFIALLEMLDPKNFHRGDSEFNPATKKRLYEIMVRRLKNEINSFESKIVFPKRKVREIEITPKEDEKNMFQLFNNYIKMLNNLLISLEGRERLKMDFIITILKKRLLSSFYAFHNSISKHLDKYYSQELINDEITIENTIKRLENEDYENDIEKDNDEKIIIANIIKRWSSNKNLKNFVDRIYDFSLRLKDIEDSKVLKIYEFIDSNLLENGVFNNERLIIFTEYKDSLDYLYKFLSKRYGEKRVLKLYGGMTSREREEIKRAFETDPEKSEVRILIATDVASEGVNLQKYCRYMIHLEIPWNPVRLEQRNGRIHRVGQTRDVFIYHFIYKDNEDYQFLKNIVFKLENIEKDIDSMNPVISETVQEKIKNVLTYKEDFDFNKEIEILNEKIKLKIKSEVNRAFENIKKEIEKKLFDTKNFYEITPENKKKILESSLEILSGKNVLKNYDNLNDIYYIESLPAEWKSLRSYIENEQNGTKKKITFESYQMNSDIEFIHLSHPLMKNSLKFFKTQIWNVVNKKLNRFSLKISKDIENLYVRLYLKSAVVDNKLDLISEDIKILSGYLFGDHFVSVEEDLNIKVYDPEDIEKAKKITMKVRSILEVLDEDFSNEIEKLKEEYKEQVEKKWKEVLNDQVEALKVNLNEQIIYINELIKRLEKNKKDIEKKSKINRNDQLVFDANFNIVSVDKYESEIVKEMEENIKYLKRKKEILKEDIEKIVKDLKDRKISHYYLLPIAMEVIVPEKEWKDEL